MLTLKSIQCESAASPEVLGRIIRRHVCHSPYDRDAMWQEVFDAIAREGGWKPVPERKNGIYLSPYEMANLHRVTLPDGSTGYLHVDAGCSDRGEALYRGAYLVDMRKEDKDYVITGFSIRDGEVSVRYSEAADRNPILQNDPAYVHGTACLEYRGDDGNLDRVSEHEKAFLRAVIDGVRKNYQARIRKTLFTRDVAVPATAFC